jgi:CheY-like chemotaxis protein
MSDHKKTILIVDDEPSNLLLLSTLLKQDYKIIAAKSGDKAFVLANKTPGPDLIMLDVVMPGMTGYELCELLKETASTANIPVIFISANNSQEQIAHAKSIGGADYLVKPVNPVELKAVLTQYLNVPNL